MEWSWAGFDSMKTQSSFNEVGGFWRLVASFFGAAMLIGCSPLSYAEASGVLDGVKTTLTGVVKIGEALMTSIQFGKELHPLLQEGQSFSGVEVVSISWDPPGVTIAHNGERVLLTLAHDKRSGQTEGIEFGVQTAEMQLSEFANLYQLISGKTLLRSAMFLREKFSFSAGGSRGELEGKMIEAFQKHGFAVTNMTDKMDVLTRIGTEPALTKKVQNIGDVKGDDVLPAGAISLQLMPFDQFVQLYEIYSGLKVERARNLPTPLGMTCQINLDITRTEVVHAFETLFLLEGIRIEPVHEGKVRLLAR